MDLKKHKHHDKSIKKIRIICPGGQDKCHNGFQGSQGYQ
jgi:hypothetical protein